MINFLDVKPLFVFDIANNHMGSVEHGLKIIREIHNVTKFFPFKFAFKFQYRNLDTFIHPDYKTRYDFRYIKRFSETKLSDPQFKRFKDELDVLGFISVCTPFDELSVDLVEKQGIDVIKIASCSFTDWPLLERIVTTDKPIITSTAGASLDDLDKVVSFFEHRNRPFALMHCVAEYSTSDKNLQLNQISLLRSRYPGILVGYSTHEDPNNFDSIKIAIAKGASIFEKHVGVAEDGFTLNAYSANPSQIEMWLRSAEEAITMCGKSGVRHDFTDDELESLHALRRGVFAKRPLNSGEKISLDDIFLAIPLHDGQLTANDLSKYVEFFALGDMEEGAPVFFEKVKRTDMRKKVYEIVQKVKALMKQSNVVVPGKADLEISHHYGLDRFEEFGITMITVVNRIYCKKLIIVLPGQKHPEQYHAVKEETFHILYGKISISLDGKEQQYSTGDVVVIERGIKHAFGTNTGAIIEEISSTHYGEDSYYTDPQIMSNKNRKTLFTYWMDK